MYTIYVIELSKKAYSEHHKFRSSNPQYNGVLQCLYVGMTAKHPRTRLQQHLKASKSKKGHNLASAIVHKYGLYLRPSLYEHLPKIRSRSEALQAEEYLAKALKKKGYAVWWN